MNQSAEIPVSQNEIPYFINIPRDSPYFVDVQSAVDWNIYETQYDFDPNQELTREVVAYTLVNLSGIDLVDSSKTIRDLSNTNFPRHVQAAVAFGLMNVNKNQQFLPNQVISKEESNQLLNQVVQYINTKQFQSTKNEISFKDDVDIETIESEQIEDETITLPSNSPKSMDSYLYEPSSDSYYRIDSVVEENENEITYHTTEVGLEEFIEFMDIENSFTVDFTTAEIIDSFDPITQETSYVEPTSIRRMSLSPLTKSMNINGYQVSYQVTAAGIHASVSKNYTNSEKMLAELSLNHVVPSYQWKMQSGDIDQAYFRVDFETNESLKFTSNHNKLKYGDFSQMDSSSLISIIQSTLKDNSEVASTTIPICTVKVPVPEAPYIQIVMVLQLKLYVTGKVELVLSQKNQYGMEIRNGNFRKISNTTNSSNAIVQADSGITGNLMFGFQAEGFKLADINCELGAKSKLNSTIHLYDKEGTHSTKEVSYSYDDLMDITDGNGDVLVCADLNAYWVSNVHFNSTSTLAGKLGFSKTIQLFDESSGKLIPGMKTHLENGHFVDHCTRKERDKTIHKDDVIDSDQIRIKDYSMILDIGESKKITITGLPKEISLNELQFSSNNISIASVDGNGNVIANQEGSAMITISTSDKQFQAFCNILVRTPLNT